MEYQGSNISKRYVHSTSVDTPLVQYTGASVGPGNRQFLHKDHQGTVIAISNNSGAVIATNTYDAYGVPATGNQGRFGYTGQMYLSELGLYHYRARVYNPHIGRFLQTDPIGYEDQMNLYAYVGNDPLNNIDPTGMFDLSVMRNMQAQAVMQNAASNPIVQNRIALGQTVSGLESMANGLNKVSNASQGLALVSMTAGQLEIAGPASTVSTVTNAVGSALQLGADAIKGQDGAGKDFLKSNSPSIAGTLTENLLKAVKVPDSMAQAAGIAVDSAMTAANVAEDIVESMPAQEQQPRTCDRKNEC